MNKQAVSTQPEPTSSPEITLVPAPKHITDPPKKRVRNYLNNPDLLTQVKLSKEKGKMTDVLAHMLVLLCKRYATKPGYSGYTYNDDMQGYAMMMLCKTWHKFDENKSDNPFAFYTQCIKHSFIQYLNQEKRQRDIRDELLIDGGMNPSYTYQLEHGSNTSSDDYDYGEPESSDYEIPTSDTLDPTPSKSGTPSVVQDVDISAIIAEAAAEDDE
jgi:DNA-directed RNA polymerase specialized sigma subunit